MFFIIINTSNFTKKPQSLLTSSKQTLCQVPTALWICCRWIGVFFFFTGWRWGVGRRSEWRQQRGRICPLRSVWMYTSGPGVAALGASRLLNTPILGSAGAGQVISIIRGEGSHTYGNAAVGGVRLVLWVLGGGHVCVRGCVSICI